MTRTEALTMLDMIRQNSYFPFCVACCFDWALIALMSRYKISKSWMIRFMVAVIVVLADDCGLPYADSGFELWIGALIIEFEEEDFERLFWAFDELLPLFPVLLIFGKIFGSWSVISIGFFSILNPAWDIGRIPRVCSGLTALLFGCLVPEFVVLSSPLRKLRTLW